MNPEDIARILDDLGQRLGPSGEYVFGLAVRQALISGWTSVTFVVIAAALLTAGLIIARRYDDYEYPWVLGVILTIFGGMLGVVTTYVLLTYGVGAILNPEYAALTDLLGRIIPR